MPDDLTATPLLIPDVSFSFEDEVSNRSFVKKNSPQARVVLTTEFSGMSTSVYRTGTNSGFVFALDPLDPGLVMMAVRFEIRLVSKRFLGLDRSTTQVVLWRSERALASTNLARDVFFNVILDMTGTVVSDKEQTTAGRNFWRRRLMDASHQGLHIGLLDLGQPSIHSPRSLAELDSLMKHAYEDSKHVKHLKNLRWIISKQPLPTTK